MKSLITTLINLCFVFVLAAQGTITVKGRVLDQSNNEPVIGCSVYLKGSSTGTITDVDGMYEISAPSDGTLVFSYIGFATQEVEVGGRKMIDVSLATDAVTIDEVVVIGYGSVKRAMSPVP